MFGENSCEDKQGAFKYFKRVKTEEEEILLLKNLKTVLLFVIKVRWKICWRPSPDQFLLMSTEVCDVAHIFIHSLGLIPMNHPRHLWNRHLEDCSCLIKVALEAFYSLNSFMSISSRVINRQLCIRSHRYPRDDLWSSL